MDTHTILGQYVTELDRVEISTYLQLYPELFDFILSHELKHSNLPKYSYKNFILEIKDRYKLVADKTLRNQMNAFLKLSRPKKSTKVIAFGFIYQLFGEFYMVFLMGVEILFLLKERIKK